MKTLGVLQVNLYRIEYRLIVMITPEIYVYWIVHHLDNRASYIKMVSLYSIAPEIYKFVR